MKHIKSYKLFESSGVYDLIENVRDICLELNDINIQTRCSYNNPYFIFGESIPGNIKVYVGDKLHLIMEKPDYKWLDVKEVVLTFISYLESNNFKLKTMIRSQDDFPMTTAFLREDNNLNFNFNMLIFEFI